MITSKLEYSLITTHLKTLNDINGADNVCNMYEKKCLEEFEGQLIGVLMGIAYGGDVERCAKNWTNRGIVYGFDTFEGHPSFLVKTPTDFEATCMDHWYRLFGMDKLSMEYQRRELDVMGLTNAQLVKGLVTKDSCKDIPYINYAFLDMDILESMVAGYEAVKDKIVKGGYLVLHDVMSIPRLVDWYKELKTLPEWEFIEEGKGITGVLRKV